MPLDPARLDELALDYVARFATSTGKLGAYLRRKLRERGWAEDIAPSDLSALIGRFVERGFIDDAGYARARGESLRRRGFGDRRIDQTLGHDGISADLRAAVRASRQEARAAALAFARKRRLGPFTSREEPGTAARDAKLRDRQMAALLRAGHPLDSARRIVDAADIAEIEEWVLEGADDEAGA